MYEHYTPSDQLFVNRDVHIDWMVKALKRCKERAVVLNLHGIGGIGKSALIEQWKISTDNVIFLNCDQVVDFYDRLDVLARGAVLLGVGLRRFDILWHIRLRFVKGVEPAKEKGRGWALEALSHIPFIGTLGNIGGAIQMIGKELGPRISRKFGDVGEWLRTNLGKDYGAILLEMLWKDPHRAEILFLDALLEDINNRKDPKQPIILLMDTFESVDNASAQWRIKGRKVTESELWCIFLSSLKGCVAVLASRSALPSRPSEGIEIELVELTELDDKSCRELLDKRGVTQEELQDRIVTVSGGNPFVIDAICDIVEMRDTTVEDVDSLRADTLEEVRLKTWRNLFSQAEGLLKIIDRTALVPFFNKSTMDIINPGMRSDHWDRLKQLSFVKDRGDETWELHDLARELAIADLGERIHDIVTEVSELLENSANKQSDMTLQGIALSVRAKSSEKDAINEVRRIADHLFETHQHTDALKLFSAVSFETLEGRGVLLRSRGRVLFAIKRLADAEQVLRSALEMFRELAKASPEELSVYLAETLAELGELLLFTKRIPEAEEVIPEALAIYSELEKGNPEDYTDKLANILLDYGHLMRFTDKIDDAENAYQQALDLFDLLSDRAPDISMSGRARVLYYNGWLEYAVLDLPKAAESFNEAHEIFDNLIKKDPKQFGRWNALTLRSKAWMQIEQGKQIEGEENLRKALGLFRELAVEEPEEFRRLIALCLETLWTLLIETDRFTESEEMLEEIVEIFEEYAEREPQFREQLRLVRCPFRLYWFTWRLAEAEDGKREILDLYREREEQVYIDDYVLYCGPFSLTLHMRNKHSKALEVGHEAVQSMRELTKKAPKVWKVFLALYFAKHTIILAETGKSIEIEEFKRDYLDVLKNFSKKSPNSVQKPDAWGLCVLAYLLRQSGRLSESEVALHEALEIFRKSVEDIRAPNLRYLTWTLNNLGVLLRHMDRPKEAEAAYQEALDIGRELVQKAPIFYPPHVARILNNLGVLLRNTDRAGDAEEAYREALEINRKFMEKAPDAFPPRVASTLNNLAVLFVETERAKEAAKAFQEALKIRRKLCKKEPSAFQPSLISSLSNMGIMFRRTGKVAKAEKMYREALELSESIIHTTSEVRLSIVKNTLGNFAVLLSTMENVDEDLEGVRSRLKEMGVKQLPNEEIWFEDEEEEVIAYFL